MQRDIVYHCVGAPLLKEDILRTHQPDGCA
jgi:hypothetical protein